MFFHVSSKLNLEDTKMRMKTDDRDKDGFVTWDEYLESTYGMSESELEEFKKDDVDAKESQHQMDKVQKWFGLSIIGNVWLSYPPGILYDSKYCV